jgi:hypothetical protein
MRATARAVVWILVGVLLSFLIPLFLFGLCTKEYVNFGSTTPVVVGTASPR